MDIFLKTTGALYDETRVQILRFISERGEVCVCEIEAAFNMIQSRISRHLKILKEAGFLKVDRRGKWAYYAIRSPLDRFRLACLDEIACLDISFSEVKNSCKASV